MSDDLHDRYPHGVLLEQEGGVPNDAIGYENARHICRKHRVREDECPDARRLGRRLLRFVLGSRPLYVREWDRTTAALSLNAEELLRARLSLAWCEGYARGMLDNERGAEPADNPYC